ncbi:MAG: RidA family protein [Proteobacteria bacterium]|nr:RidA family protein [Pseudomonadota bacterium]
MPRIALFVLLLCVTGCPQQAPTSGPHRDVVVKPPTFASNYSPAIRTGGLVFLSGMVGFDAATGELVPGGVGPETKQAVARIKETLGKAGLGLRDVVKCTVLLADIADYETMNRAYRPLWPSEPPARTTMQATPPLDARVEIECIAAAK